MAAAWMGLGLGLAVATAAASGSGPAGKSGGDQPPHVLFIVGDDVGYSDFGFFNDAKTITPTIDGLLESGIFLSDYYTFKICSPSRAAMLTGRYPWGAGFYDMSQDSNHVCFNFLDQIHRHFMLNFILAASLVHAGARCLSTMGALSLVRQLTNPELQRQCTTNSTALPELLKPLGYRTHALGKWDVGFMKKECSPTERGYDTFFGYYLACEADYWYHAQPGQPQPNCSRTGMGIGNNPTDLSNNTAQKIGPSSPSLNGTYNTKLIADEAARLVLAHNTDEPFYMYLAFMAVHDGCGEPSGPFFSLGKQAPLATVELYNTTVLDTYKVAGAMYTELDRGIDTVISALKLNRMWDDTVLIFVSDNGGPLDHCTNEPLRGGKHTFFEGGVRVMSFISGPLIPENRRGTRWSGMAASADWYKTITEGIAGGTLPKNTGYRPPDAINLWPAIISGGGSPRTEVVHQVQNQWSCDVTQPGGGCVSSMRMGEMKLIIGGPGDSRTVEKPALCIVPPKKPSGYLTPCPRRGFEIGCMVECGDGSGPDHSGCDECYESSGTKVPKLITPTAAACQAACAADKKCGFFQWIGVGGNKSGSMHHECIFKCGGALDPSDKRCRVGKKIGEAGGSYVCGPKRNDSSAPPLPPAASPSPTPSVTCPVPFGLTSGVVEAGTDHARADGLKGTRTDLTCNPWCLFNLTSDIGERNDLGSNPAYQDIARKIAARLKYHGSTGPMPAYIWPDRTVFKEKNAELCAQSLSIGYVEPIDLNGNDRGTTTLLD